MAFTPNNSLQTDPTVIFRDQQHAARLFTDDQFRLAPKLDFLFHVAFSINTAAVKDTALMQRHGTEINMLVKTATLPKFDLTVETVNQYNRKKVIQTTSKLNDATIKFHDDNMSLINQLWQNYYSYYYADSNSAKTSGAYSRNATRSSDFIYTPYGLDNGSTDPFFNSITIYQMARHEYTSVKLINPLIKSWDGHTVDYSSSKAHDFSMVFAFEAVEYGAGIVQPGDPVGFAIEHYDNTSSPLQGIGNPLSASPSFIGKPENSLANLTSALTQVNIAQNSQASTSPVSTTGLLNVTPLQTISGLSGYSFPSTSTATTTVASPVSLK